MKRLSIVFLFILASCSDNEEIINKDTLIVGTSADNPPYEYIQNGKIVGLDIDIIREIGNSIGKKIVIKNLDFPGLLPALTSKNVDLIIAGITVTDERKKKVDFSKGYISTEMAILYRKSDNFKSVNDLTKKLLGVQTGTTWEAYAKSLTEKITDMRIRSLSNNLILVEELKAGNIDAIIFEKMQVLKFVENIKELDSLSLEDTKGEFAIALPKDSPLTPIIDKAIDKLLLDNKLQEVKDKWLLK
ncbi:MAG UNVERIFIED_CONTAM: ABC transporter substrate-binding protein [Rickettsiaceae bacterium]